jgi:SagB-type dehydrogenase family enzyme
VLVAERSLPQLLVPTRDPDALWEVFHENSKNFRASLGLTEQSAEQTQARMQELHEELPYAAYPRIALPAPQPIAMSLTDAIAARRSERSLRPDPPTAPELATLLHHAYGMMRDNRYVPYPPRTRAVPSAGALYPLELYVHGAVAGLGAGLYHYSPKHSALHHLDERDLSAPIAAATLYPEYVAGASLIVFVTAMFERSTWKYGDRGYRYALLEAGHLVQNLDLVATALGFASFNLGGYFDREIDDLLGIDGITHSTVYMICIGR